MKKALIVSAALLAFAGAASQADTAAPLPKHQLPVSKAGLLVVGNCDGQSAVEVPGKKEGEKLTDAEARQVTKQLMDSWQEKHPGQKWQMAGESSGQSSKDPTTQVATGEHTPNEAPRQHGIYANYTPEDEKTWALEQSKLIEAGKQIFHSADRLGSKTAISCDMCHPNAANTHPETYPKYQVQLQRVAMLRDMINWCIENPVKGAMMKDDDPRMKALEAYIISQRAGVPLAPGKH